MPLYKVDFTDNLPSSAVEITGEEYQSLKELTQRDGRTYINWYIVQATDETGALQMAEKIVYQVWGDLLSDKITGDGAST